MGWWGRRERALFRTHKPPFRQAGWAVGQLVEHEGALYRVTRWVELRPVSVERGGLVAEWEIRGRRLSRREMRQELFEAAERIKGGDSSR